MRKHGDNKYKILKETYDMLVKHEWNAQRVADMMGLSVITIHLRKRQMKEFDFNLPTNYECNCFPTNEYRLNYLDKRN